MKADTAAVACGTGFACGLFLGWPVGLVLAATLLGLGWYADRQDRRARAAHRALVREIAAHRARRHAAERN